MDKTNNRWRLVAALTVPSVALVALLVCSCSQAAPTARQQVEPPQLQPESDQDRDLYDDDDRAQASTSSASSPYNQPVLRERPTTQQPLQHNALDYMPDDLSVEEILRMIESNEALEGPTTPRSMTTSTTTTIGPVPTTESVVIRRVVEAHESWEARQAREAREALVAHIERRRAAALLAERQRVEEQPRRTNEQQRRHMEEMFGPPAASELDVQRIADELLQREESRQVEVMRAGQAHAHNYDHLDQSAADATNSQLAQLEAALERAPEYKPQSEEEICRICLEGVGAEGRAVRLQCGDAFHSQCLRRWARTQNSHLKDCPTCRKPAKF